MTQRKQLRLKWRTQGRRCTYCDELATQVDHVVPLALGGTNYEGNLTPCCASCNVRKSDSLLIEWKWKVRVKRARVEPPPLPVMRRGPVDYTKRVCGVHFLECAICAKPFVSRYSISRYCPDHTYGKRRTPLVGSCVVCQGVLEHGPTKPKLYCSKACRKRSPVVLAYKRTEKYKQSRRERKRRARLRARSQPETLFG